MSSLSRISPTALKSTRPSSNSREQTLAEIVGQDRVVTRVAVTVRTKTFFTRTKIRKLPPRARTADAITQTALELSA